MVDTVARSANIAKSAEDFNKEGGWLGASDKAVANIARSVTTYSGPYELVAADNGEIALDLSWLGVGRIGRT